eukprot:UN29037
MKAGLYGYSKLSAWTSLKLLSIRHVLKILMKNDIELSKWMVNFGAGDSTIVSPTYKETNEANMFIPLQPESLITRSDMDIDEDFQDYHGILFETFTWENLLLHYSYDYAHIIN